MNELVGHDHPQKKTETEMRDSKNGFVWSVFGSENLFMDSVQIDMYFEQFKVPKIGQSFILV